MTDTKKLPDQKLAEIKDNFKFFDRDDNNQIDLDEFTQLLKVISPSTTLEQAETGFSLVDENKDGHIDFEEFKVVFNFS